MWQKYVSNFIKFFRVMIDPDKVRLFEPCQLRQDCLPTKRDIYCHYLYLRKVKEERGEWRQDVPIIVAVREVLNGVKRQWSKTEIPHIRFWGGGRGRRI